MSLAAAGRQSPRIDAFSGNRLVLCADANDRGISSERNGSRGWPEPTGSTPWAPRFSAGNPTQPRERQIARATVPCRAYPVGSCSSCCRQHLNRLRGTPRAGTPPAKVPRTPLSLPTHRRLIKTTARLRYRIEFPSARAHSRRFPPRSRPQKRGSLPRPTRRR